MKKLTLESKNEAQTTDLGLKIAQNLKGGEVIGLTGDLGTGKTFLAKSILKNFCQTQGFSPTFVIDAVYEVKRGSETIFVHHLDLYRLEKTEELVTLGVIELLGKHNHIFLVEWADRLPLLPSDNKLIINLSLLKEQSRQITLTSFGKNHEKLLSKIK